MHSLRKRGGGPGPGRGAGGSAQPVFGNPEEGGQDSLRAPLLVLGFCLGACEAAGDEQQRGSNILKRGDLKVIKGSEDNLVEGVRFH